MAASITSGSSKPASRFIKALVAGFVFALACAYLACLSAYAAPIIETAAVEEHAAIEEELLEALPSNEEQFADYVESVFYGNARSNEKQSYGESVLTGGSLALYNALKEKCTDVANGDQSSTEFSVSSNIWSEYYLTDEEYGGPIVVDGQISAGAVSMLAEKTLGKYSFTDVVNYLIMDCPYILYWFDKTLGCAYSLGGSIYKDGKLVWNQDAFCCMYVEEAYSVSGQRGTFNFKTSDAQLAKDAAANAQEIVNQYADSNYSDYQKLLAYKNEICNLVSYDFAAADNPNTPYGNPWQIIYVFDKDPKTNVVCEGYAKAFQYLCDLSTFSGYVESYIVEGQLSDWANGSGAHGGGAHMWNHVTIGGKTYMVDVTNCDTDMVGSPNYLFLAGTQGSAGNSYTFTINGQDVEYQFDANTKSLYAGSGILTLASSSYGFDSFSASGSSTSVTYGDSKPLSFSVSAGPDSAVSSNVPVYEWFISPPDQEYELIEGANVSSLTLNAQDLIAGSNQVYCQVSLYDGNDVLISATSSPVYTINVARRPIDIESVEGLEPTKVYDGTTGVGGDAQYELSGVLPGDTVFVNASSIAYSSPNAGRNTITLSGFFLNGQSSTNYVLRTGSYTFPGEIYARPFSDGVAFKLLESSYVYKGSSIAPSLSLKYGNKALVEGTDYTVTYDNDPVDIGSYKMTIRGIKNYTGEKTADFEVLQAPLSLVDIKIDDITYKGSARKPAPSITYEGKQLLKGRDYTITYKDNVNVGNAKATITGLGNYTGMRTEHFKVLPKNTKIKKLHAEKKGFTVKWSKLSTKMKKNRIAGYEVRYSLKSSMKSAKIKKAKGYTKTSLKVTKLKAKKKYYVQVRTYMKVGGKTYYSAWSKAKHVKTKK